MVLNLGIVSGHELTLWVEQSESKHVAVADVVPVAPVDKIYAFAVPESLKRTVELGHRVRVPLGRSDRLYEGFVVALDSRQWDTTLKYLDTAVEQHSWLDAHLLELGRWISRYYATPLGRTLKAMVPAAVRRQSGFKKTRLLRLSAAVAKVLEDLPRVGPKQRLLLEAMPEPDQEIPAADICRRIGVSSTTVNTLVNRGALIAVERKIPPQAPDFDEPIVEPDFELTTEQCHALKVVTELLDRHQFEVALLYGISGSGKTEVYIDAMRRVVEAGQQVIVLVPEIALTTQLVHRFASRFTDVAVLHSGLTGVKRSLVWNAIRAGDKRVVIGTRSTVFAPCRDLGLIVIDEEQDSSYKNQQAPRFHARDAAIKRAQLLNIPVVMGSATPALETWANCSSKEHYTRIHLTHRVAGLQLPSVELVDMREQVQSQKFGGLLSGALEGRIREALARNEQAVLLLNRRGYASALFCPKCKLRVQCDHCRANMVFHRITGVVMCHHCHSKMTVPEYCADPSCATRLIHYGVGTERVEEVLRRRFPDARVQRVDSDTMQNIREYERVVSAFEKREIDILIGTQMIAKGLDFPYVSVVGVISADTALFFPDFRANETTFQLVTQVAGRAGRGQTGGQVVVQTLMSDLPALKAAMNHDYDSFAEQELRLRRELQLPPYARMTRWVLSDPNESKLWAEAQAFAELLRGGLDDLGLSSAELIGPFPSPIERIRKRYRADILCKTADAAARQRLLDHVRLVLKPKVRVQRLIVDVDPTSML